MANTPKETKRKTSIKYKRLLISQIPEDGGMGYDFINAHTTAREGTAQFQGSASETTEYKNISGGTLETLRKKGAKTMNWQSSDLNPDTLAFFTHGKVTNTDDYVKYSPPADGTTQVNLSVQILTASNILIELPNVNFDSYPVINDDDLHYFMNEGSVQLPEKVGVSDFNFYVLSSTGVTKNDIIALTVDNMSGTATIDSSAHTATVSVTSGTDIKTVIPHIKVSQGAYVIGSGIPTDFTQPVVYTVISADGTVQDWTITVTVA